MSSEIGPEVIRINPEPQERLALVGSYMKDEWRKPILPKTYIVGKTKHYSTEIAIERLNKVHDL